MSTEPNVEVLFPLVMYAIIPLLRQIYMGITGNAEEAKCFETLASILGDERKALALMKDLEIDGSSPLPFYANAIYAATGKTNDELCAMYKTISEAFDSEKIDYSILSYTNPLFPHNKSIEPVYYLYVAGKKELLSKKRVTCLGSPLPSLQGKSDMAACVEAIVHSDGAVLAPLDTGLGAFALSRALKEGGSAIGVLSSSISKCPSAQLLELMGELYEKGLLITQFAPSVKSQKWHVVLRNRFIAGISENVYLAEDKDGGPGWAIFDLALELGANAYVSSSLVDNPNYKWARERTLMGAKIEKTPKDISRLFASKRKDVIFDDLTPDLFS